MYRCRTLWRSASVLLVLMTILLSLTASAQSEKYRDKVWSRVKTVAPAAVPAVSDKPSRHFSSLVRVGALPPQDSPDVRVGVSSTLTQSENSIAVNPLNNLKVLNSNNSSDYPVSNIFGASGYMSSDGGLTWTGSPNGTGGNNSGDPAVAIDLTGRYYNNYIGADDGNGNAWSTNEGATWTNVQVTPVPGSGGLADKNHMTVDNSPTSPYAGYLYAAWSDFGATPDNQIAISRSTNGGLTWSAKTQISTAINAGSHNQGVNIQTGPNGEVYVIWAVYDAWPAAETAIGFAKSTNGGASWQTAVRAITNIKGIRSQATGGGLLGGKDQRTASFPSMAVNQQNGNIFVVWANIGVPGTNTGTERDVYMARSTDGGATFGTAIRVNQDVLNNGKDQWFPWIACDPVSGALVVAFYDSRDFTANDQAATYCAVSYDSGTTWEDFRVSDASWSGDGSGTGFSSNYAGDYIGIAIRNGRAYPVWTDLRSPGTSQLQTWVSPFLVYPPNAGFVKGIVTTGGSPLSGVRIDFTESVTQIPSTTDGTGYYKASASVEPGTTSQLHIRAQKFGYVTKTETLTVVRSDTVTRNISLVTAPGGTLQVHAYRNDNSGIRAWVQVIFGGTTVVSDSTNATTGLLSVPLPTGTYDVVVDPPSPYGTRTFTGIVINASQTTTVQSLVRYVLEPAPAAMRDTLVVGQTHAKTLALTNTTTDSVAFRITDDNALRPSTRPRAQHVKTYEGYELPKDAVDTHEGIGGTEGRGGPDAFGYQWVDSDEPDGPAFNWVDISSIGTPITTWTGTDDDGHAIVTLPWSFPMYGTAYTQLKIVTNGWVSLDAASTNHTYSNTAIPASAEPNLAIYPWWDDLDLGDGGTISYYDDAANSRFIVQWTAVPHYGTSTPGLYTFQVILYPNGNMLYQYLDMQTTLNSATIGIENATGTDGLQTVYDAAYVHNNLAVLFKLPDAPWISESPVTGTIPPGGTQNVTVTFNATGLTTGDTYSALLSIDPSHPDVTGVIDVPASLKVQLASSAVLILNKSTVSFPATQINTTRRDTITAKNGGATTLTISSITRTNTDFTVSPASASLAPGDSLKVPVTYTPTAVGADTGRVVFMSNSQGTPRLDVILDGTAIGAPAISVAPTTITDTLQTGTNHSKSFTITNTTPVPTTPLMVTLTESLPWASVTPAADTLAGTESGPFAVTFDATGLSVGVYTGSISIASNDPATPSTAVACTLRVVGGPVIVTVPDTLRHSLAIGAQAVDTLVIRNTGVLPLTWTLTESPAVPPQRPAGPAPAAVELPKDKQDTGTSGSVIEGQGGPDAYGYRWIDSDEPGGPAFNWFDISSIGTQITTWTGTSDDGRAIVSIPFAFPWYGTGYTQLKVVTNGFISFDVVSTNNTYSNTAIPATAEPNLCVYPWWDDLDLSSSGTVHYYHDAANSRFIVQWTNVPHYTVTGTGLYTFQVILNASGSVLVQYLDMQTTLNSATIGIENAGGTDGLQVVYNATYVHNNMALMFSRGISWLSESPTSGTVNANDSAKVAVTFNATGLAAGVYNGVLQIASNDFNNNPKNVGVKLTVGGGGPVSVSLNTGWNMISNPVTATNDSVHALFPTATFAYAFGYQPGSGYVQESRLLNGHGYWEKFPSAGSQSISGTARTSQAIALQTGWNMIGSITTAIDTSAATTTPPGLRNSPFYQFGAGYTVASTIVPGKAYWVKSSGAGTMTLTGTVPALAASSAQPANPMLEKMSELTITDAAGQSQTLLIGTGQRDMAAWYELPPAGPEGCFDVRFESQRMLEVVDPAAQSAREFPLVLRSAVAPVTVHWVVREAGPRLSLRDGVNGTLLPSRKLEGTGSVVLTQNALNRLILTAAPEGVPAAFSLGQNYPNPFNPSTRLSYALAEPSRVNLAVYDILGRKVATLDNGQMDAGYYLTEWNGHNDAGMAVSSGIYFCRIDATGNSGNAFHQTIKMMLMK
jgi:hypothetical protein